MTDVYDLLMDLEEMDYGPERVALAEEAVRQADVHNDEEAGHSARMALVEAAVMSGQAEKSFAPFAWCVDFAERFPEAADGFMLAWSHKWVLNAALNFPQIPLSRIHELHQSYAKHARKLGGGSVSVPYMRLGVAMHTGDREGARRFFKAWEHAQNDILSDCSACEAHTEAQYHAFMGDHEACVKQCLYIIKRKMTCGEIPHLVYGTMLHSMRQLGREEEAKTYAAAGRKMVMGHPDFLSTQAEHLEFLAHTDTKEALKWYERHLSILEGSKERLPQMEFHAAAARLFDELQKNEPDVASLANRRDHHLEQAESLAKQFDERNGTDHQMSEVRRRLS